MKNCVESCYLIKFEIFRVNRDQIMVLGKWLQIQRKISSVDTASSKTIQTFNFLWFLWFLFKVGKHELREFHLSFFQMVGEWDFQLSQHL